MRFTYVTPRRRQRRRPRPRLLAAAFLPGGLACLALAALVGSAIPETLAKEHGYSSARPCAAAAPAGDTDCLRLVPYRVTGTVIFHGRGSRYEARLSDGAHSPASVRFRTDSPLLARLAKGDPVLATVWRGQITEVSGRGTSQATLKDPTGDHWFSLVLALLLATVGAFGVWFAQWLLRHPEDYAAGRTRPVTVAGWVVMGVLALVPLALGALVIAGSPVWFQVGLSAGFLALAWKWGRPSLAAASRKARGGPRTGQRRSGPGDPTRDR
ncbi:hypothetical protein [Streptomyces sp. NBC_00096]|uniref:hypothetical protein n=1 Tax=Streptomyces sp. NBC_00096 TaxID=2975650 RepID=UPI0032434C1C